MKKKFKLLTLLVIAFLVMAAFANLISQKSSFKQRATEQMNDLFNTQWSVTSWDLSVFPSPRLVAKTISITSDVAGIALELEADKATVSFKLAPLIFGRYEIKEVKFIGSNVKIELVMDGMRERQLIQFNDVLVEISSATSPGNVRFLMRDPVGGNKRKLQISGDALIRNTENELTIEHLDTAIQFKNTELKSLHPFLLSDEESMIKSGRLDWAGRIFWANNRFSFQGRGRATDYMGPIPFSAIALSAPVDADMKLEGGWEPDTSALHLAEMTLSTTLGDYKMKGNWTLLEPERAAFGFELNADHIEMAAVALNAESLYRKLPSYANLVGTFSTNIFLNGTSENYSVIAGLDATDLAIASKQFKKPAGESLQVEVDWNIEDGERVGGNFGIWIKDMSMKGTVVEWQRSTGDGEVTLLTNKFSLNGWEAFFPAIQGMAINGMGKLLWLASGDFYHPSRLDQNLTINLVDAEARLPEIFLSKIKATLEFASSRAATGNLELMAGSSPLRIEYVAQNEPMRSLSIVAYSPELNVSETLLPTRDLVYRLMDETSAVWVDFLKQGLHALVPENGLLTESTLRLSWLKDSVSIHEWSGGLFDGRLKLSGDFELAGVPNYNLVVQADHVDAERIFYQLSGALPVSGDLSALLYLSGDQLLPEMSFNETNLSGELKIVSGYFKAFDLSKALSNSFSGQGGGILPSGQSSFNDFYVSFEKPKNSDWISEQVIFSTDEYTLTGGGELGLTGDMNFKLRMSPLRSSSAEATSFDSMSAPAMRGLVQVYGPWASPLLTVSSLESQNTKNYAGKSGKSR